MIRNFKMNKRIVVSLMSFYLVSMNLSGCGSKIEPVTTRAVESVDEDSYNIKKDDNHVIIELEGNNFEFAYKVKLSDVVSPWDKDNEYSKYYDSQRAYATNTYLYFKTNGELLSIKYVDPNMGRDAVGNIIYEINEIISEDTAYNYMVKYMGDASAIGYEDIQTLIEKIEDDNSEKIKKK